MRRLALALALSVALVAAACSSGSDDKTATPSPQSQASATAASAGSTPAASAPAATSAPKPGAYTAQKVLPKVNFDLMLALEPIPGDTEHALVVSKDGMIRRVSLVDDNENPTVFMDISSRLISNPGMEEGLLGVAFAPDYISSHRFYLYFSAGNPRRQVISRFTSSGKTADPATEQVLLEIQDPFSNHNGGAMAFGPDGYLYIGEGDGGSAGDPNGNGQNTDALLAKIMRIDVSGDSYTVPADNPFAQGGGRGEIWAYGFRNPWRFSFDPATGRLWAGDVGQNKYEEVDEVTRGGNYGWNVLEGNHCYKPNSGCDTGGKIAPRAEYSHDDGCSITGGYVYRGRAMPELDGWYVYSDFCSGKVWALNTRDTGDPVQIFDSKKSVTSFGQDAQGELYLVTFNNEIDKIVRS